MNDFLVQRASDAELIRGRMDGKDGILSVYKGREILRQVRVDIDDYIMVLVGRTWHRAWVSPTGLRALMVK